MTHCTALRRMFQVTFYALLMVMAAGCIHPNKAHWQKTFTGKKEAHYHVAGFSGLNKELPPLMLQKSNILDRIAGTATNGATLISYSAGLAHHAALFARLTEHSLAEAERQIGFRTGIRPHLYLLHLPGESRRIRWTLPMTSDLKTMPFLIVLTNNLAKAGTDAPSVYALLTDMKQVLQQVSFFTHEMYELRLIDLRDPLAMPDVRAGAPYLHWTFKYHTRWFREGYASYAAYYVTRAFLAQVRELGTNAAEITFPDIPFQPYENLAKVKNRLFAWNQTTSHNDDANYSASLGLFLLLDHRKGPAAITAVVNDLPSLKTPDGDSILRLFQTNAGVDVVELVKNFNFPDFGLELEFDSVGQPQLARVKSGTPAARAGLSAGDSLLEVNGTRVTSAFDLDVKLFQAFEAGHGIELTISGKAGGNCTVKKTSLK